MVIDNLASLRLFARVVALGSLSAAARDLDMSLPSVSKRLAQLEQALGVRLIQRTTRRQVLTEDGGIFHEHVLRILQEVDQAEIVMAWKRQTVDGVLRFSAPVALGRRWLTPIVADFQRENPRLVIHMELTDAILDLHAVGFDLAIRFGALPDSSLIARELAPNYRILCASPTYLAAHGVPERPEELVHHRCILIGSQSSATWRFEGDSAQTVTVTASFVTNDGEASHRLALEGAGIAMKSIWDVGDDVAAGRLRRVLPDHPIASAPLNAVYAHTRNVPPRARAFVDYLGHRLRKEWRWPRQ